MKKYINSPIGVFLLLLISFLVTASGFAAETVGLPNARIWSGNGARVQNYEGGIRHEVNAQVTDQKNDTTYAFASQVSEEIPDAEVEGWGKSAYQTLKGQIYAEGYDYRWQAGGFYRDQLYFETINGLPADLAMTFHVSATGTTADEEEAMAFLSLGWNLYFGDGAFDYYTLGYETILDLHQDEYKAVNANFTLHSINSPVGYLIESGTYVPFSVSVWGTVINGDLNWANTIDSFEFTAFQDGRQLDSNEYTIQYGVLGTPVPEPSTWVMLGLGLMGVIGIARKKSE
jgi:hypothetical protein